MPMCSASGRPSRSRQRCAQRSHARMHLERRVQGALRVVLVRHRRAEDRHHRITDEFLDECVEPLDHPAQGAEQVGLQRPHVLGIQPLGDRCESGQVCEQHGGRSAIGFRCDGSYEGHAPACCRIGGKTQNRPRCRVGSAGISSAHPMPPTARMLAQAVERTGQAGSFASLPLAPLPALSIVSSTRE